jgi:hypothetical protein
MHFFKRRSHVPTAPVVCFIGPDASDTIYIQSPSGILTPVFRLQHNHTKPQLTVHYVLPSGELQPFFSASLSSASASITIQFANHQEVKMRHSWEGMQSRKEFVTPLGKLTWMPDPSGWGDTMELWGKNKQKLGQYVVQTDSRKNDGNSLEFYQEFDKPLMDVLVASALCMYKESIKETKALRKMGDVLAAIGDVAQAL